MILLIVEHDNNNLNISTKHVISAAHKLNDKIFALVAGYNCQQVCDEIQNLDGLHQIIMADSKEYEHQLAENVSELICDLAPLYNYILAPATTFGKDLLPRVAAKLNVEQISDITEIVDHDTFVRPIYAGNAFATVQSQETTKVITIRPTSFPECKTVSSKCEITKTDKVFAAKHTTFVKMSTTDHGALPDLNSAKIIVAGGRGFKTKKNFAMLEELASTLHAAIGASRAAVDAGFVSNDLQIGQTGKVVAPDLYIAIGISGAIQHLAGMQDSRVIVAINIDPDAPIFGVADYGLVGDLFEIVPELISRLVQDR